MAAVVEGRIKVPADQLTVWTKLNDPSVLQRCIKGCERFERTSETTFVAESRTKVGPFRISVTGRIALERIDPPNGCLIVAEGEGGFVGFASGTADLRLGSTPGGTEVTYVVDASLGGKLAHIGGRIVNAFARKAADHFFAAFSAVIVADSAAAPQI